MAQGRWLVVLPDHEPAAGLAQRLRGHAPRELSHPSGRAWLLGDWAEDELTVGTAGTHRIAVLGPRTGTVPDLAAAAGSVRDADGLDGLAARLPGSFHLLASLDGTVRAQGSVFASRRLFRTTVDGYQVAADRADVLAALGGGTVDPRRLAMGTAYPALPHPVPEVPYFTGVHEIPGDRALYLENSGAARERRWWRPPEPVLPLAEGAALLRSALLDSMATRVAAGDVVAADLSGGLDSTSLCFLAHGLGADLVTVTVNWSTPGNEDHRWSGQAAAELSRIERLEYAAAELPAFFTGIDEAQQSFDEPANTIREHRQQVAVYRALRERAPEARLRLSGHGADFVLQAPRQHVHDLLRRAPLTGLRHALAFRSRDRWSLGRAARMLTDTRDFRGWLRSVAAELDTAMPVTQTPQGWGDPLRLPPWLTASGARQAADLLRELTETAEELAPTRGQHVAMHVARIAGRAGRRLAHAGAPYGLPTTSPYCDDRVVEACLSARPEETHTPWEYKPLLRAALRGLVPDAVFERTTKDNSTAEWYAGMRANRAALSRLVDGSHLVAAGLADEPALRGALLSPQVSMLPPVAVEHTIACETWLRDVGSRITGDELPSGTPPDSTSGTTAHGTAAHSTAAHGTAVHGTAVRGATEGTP